MFTCNCNPDEDRLPGSFWTVDNIIHLQKLSDVFISLAYFSIPLQLFYFLTCSKLFPFRWLVSQFGAFIILCGLTHFVTLFTYTSHLSYRLMLTLTVLKSFTAILSCSTSVTLLTLIPQMLKVMVRQRLLINKTRQLDQQIGVLKKRKENGQYVRMLTQEIRSSLDRHKILYTTLVELSKLLFLENCAVWMPDESNFVMKVTHELKQRHVGVLIPVDDLEVMEIVAQRGIRLLKSDSRIGCGGGIAIRLPLFRVSDFRGRTPEMLEQRYAILVLVLKAGDNRDWSSQDLEIVEVVADQVAVALSHVAVLEESLLIKDQLLEQNAALEKARKTTLMVSKAMWSFRKVMSIELIAPSRSIAAVMSVLETENWKSEKQRRIVNTMVKGGFLLSALIEDAIGLSRLGDSRIELKSCSFSLYSMLKEVVKISEFLCSCCGIGFHFQVEKEVPDCVIGDEVRIFQALLYMVGKVSALGEFGAVVLNVCTASGSQDILDSKFFAWKREVSEEFAHLRFHVSRTDVKEYGLTLLSYGLKTYGNEGRNQGLKFNICEQLAQLMHGSAYVSTTKEGLYGSMKLTIRLQLQSSNEGLVKKRAMDPETASFLLKGMNTLLVDNDSFNQSITRKVLENLGCHLTINTSWQQCLESLFKQGHNYHLLLIDFILLEKEGTEVIAWIRQLRRESGLFVIALVLKADRDMRDHCLRNGLHGVICKPVIFLELEDELQRIIQQAPGIH